MSPGLPRLSRRHLLAAGLAAPLWPLPAKAITPAKTQALPRQALQFPRDLGSHPDFAIEWWYITGHLRSGSGSGSADSGEREFGFQLTFFRSRVAATQGMSSAFAAKQLIFAHAAVTDVAGKKLWHDQRIAREGFGLAQASARDSAVTLRDWSLVHDNQQYRAVAAGSGFQFALVLTETQPLLLQGDRGLSRKGPDVKQASYYYSLPQLHVTGTLALEGRPVPVQGTAWLDHEWSQALMPPQAVGWDWIGMNLLDGSALTAFRLRDKAGNALWDGGSFRHLSMGAVPHVFSRGEVLFKPVRSWTSPLTRASYPVEWLVRTPADFYTVKAVIDNQELDSRTSTGAIYWEGLSELFDSSGKLVGRGYLEMTGYASPLRL
ncbi:lipocalin-like domain-containing protein [Rhodoferax ferrireducens]|uniref:lipocalin-like domain-containing protein n=1 Tax=Rhodoferax ferrireducens TaxID=192843 RepID=UPI000E0DDBCB|nr:carotenoid 1,2-hydratase [Rhodoferax ferrireducens]